MEENEYARYNQDRKLAIGLWLIVFFILIVTTGGMFAPYQLIAQVSSYASFAGSRLPAFYYAIPLFAFGLVAVLVFNTWMKFLAFTRCLFVALVNNTSMETTRSIFHAFLTFPRKAAQSGNEDLERTADDANGSIIGAIIQRFAWIYLLYLVATILVTFLPSLYY